MEKQTIDFGMPTLIELDNLEETANLCQMLGLSFIELNMNLPQYQIEFLEETDYFRKIADQYGIYYTIHLDENLNIADFNHAVSQAYLETVERTIKVAGKLEIPVLNMHMNHGVHFTLPERKIELFEQYEDDYIQSILNFRTMCDKQINNTSIPRICIENTDGYREYEKRAIELLLKSNVFGLTWDFGHSHTCNNMDESFLLAHHDRLNHFHLHDALGEQNHLTLGTGEIDMTQKLQFVSNRLSKCRVVIETKTVKSLQDSVMWLKSNNMT